MSDEERFLRLLLCVVILALVVWLLGGVAHADWNEGGSEVVQDELWSLLMDEFDNPVAAAAVMGNAAVESNYCPWRYCGDTNVAGDYKDSLAYVERCSKGGFIWCWKYTVEGFGLYQFSTNEHMRNLWELSEEQGVPVYDVKLQTDYILARLKEKQPKAYEALAASTDLVDATEIFRSFAEASYCSVATMKHRTSKAVAAYEKFTGEEYTGDIYVPVFNGGSMWALKYERR